VVRDGGESNVSALALAEGLPPASAHRIVRTLERSKFLIPIGRGKFMPGPALFDLTDGRRSEAAVAAVARPELNRLARQTRHIAHLGMLESDMVTYLVKAGADRGRLFTREGMQLEAYCSGIGKVLLAHLGEEERDLYLAGGPFVALTENTKTDPAELKQELERVREIGFAVDAREVSPDLVCFAVPLRWPNGTARAAISLSTLDQPGREVDEGALVAELRQTAEVIEHRLFGSAAAKLGL
jgi:IclR family acetate operon transcriptional repressor